MNYNEINKSVGKSKVAKIFGWIFLIAGILVFITTLSTYIGWKSKENNYNKQYVYSSYGNLYYENNNDKIYVKTIYDTNNEVINLDIPNEKTVIMYCSKENMSECIYFDMNNSLDQGILNPFINIIAILFLISIGLFLMINTRIQKDDKGEEKSSLNSIYMLYVFLFVLGAGALIGQIYNAVNYFKLKNNLNVTTATIYSEIYNIGSENDLYKPVSYYYVDNQKYIYVDSYIEGNLEDNIGTTFELYYNKNNPSEVSKKENPINIMITIIGIGFVAFSTPFIFFKSKMEKRIDKNISKYKNQEWKI